MAFHPLLGSLPKGGRVVVHAEGLTSGPYLEFRDDAGNPFSDWLALFLPRGTPLVNVEVIAGAFNAALDAVPPEPETETEVVF